ncbi:MAG TPA: TatD family hydrolase [Steroidobacteraceae bacterium]|nr:TatD family hydrolase [Steroidobacteraceae bacterium]
MQSLVDIGLNLTHDSFDPDRDQLLAAAREAGVEYMLITGASLAGAQAAVDLARRHPERMRATAGIHPHHATELNSSRLPLLRQLLEQPEVVASGECGLDYFRNFSPQADQERAFRLQLELATSVGKPVFLHQRDAHAPFLSILKEYWPRLKGGVAHCFTGDLNEARDYLDMGLYIGITGWICDERRGMHLREVVRHIPHDRLLIETDAPYLLPRDLKPKPTSRRNVPAYLPHILRAVAAARGEDAESLAAATTQNARQLFGWPSEST